jgi:hypothetical protein
VSSSPHQFWILQLFAITIVGCEHVDSTAVGRPTRKIPSAITTLIDEEARTHHFGPVVSGPERQLKHVYRLTNRTDSDINIVDIVNRKPCCGVIHLETTLLHPGDETGVEILLSVRQEFGEIVHEAVLLIDPSQSEELVLRTSATAYPPIRIEERVPMNGAVFLRSGDPKRLELEAFAHGTQSERPIDLDRLELRSTVKIEWIGPKTISGRDGLEVESRPFAVVLDLDGPAGRHNAEILLHDGKGVCGSHVVNWESVTPIAASPKLIAFEPGTGDNRVVLRSRDQKLFVIKRIECDVSGIRARVPDAVAALQHVVQFERAALARPKRGRGMIAVITDHPDQNRVEVPFVVID